MNFLPGGFHSLAEECSVGVSEIMDKESGGAYGIVYYIFRVRFTQLFSMSHKKPCLVPQTQLTHMNISMSGHFPVDRRMFSVHEMKCEFMIIEKFYERIARIF